MVAACSLRGGACIARLRYGPRLFLVRVVHRGQQAKSLGAALCPVTYGAGQARKCPQGANLRLEGNLRYGYWPLPPAPGPDLR